MRKLLNPDMPDQELRLHMGELTASEIRVARAAIAWANSSLRQDITDILSPVQDYSWAGKWRVLKVLEMLK